MNNIVKLIIEIPEETYEYWKTHKDEYVLAEAIKNGIPLDAIKAEIAGMEYHMIDCDVLVSQEDVLDILDNIGKKREE